RRNSHATSQNFLINVLFNYADAGGRYQRKPMSQDTTRVAVLLRAYVLVSAPFAWRRALIFRSLSSTKHSTIFAPIRSSAAAVRRTYRPFWSSVLVGECIGNRPILHLIQHECVLLAAVRASKEMQIDIHPGESPPEAGVPDPATT